MSNFSSNRDDYENCLLQGSNTVSICQKLANVCEEYTTSIFREEEYYFGEITPCLLRDSYLALSTT
jgi:hypothetical protein